LLGTITGGVLVALPDGERMVSLGLMGVALTGYLTSRWIPMAGAATPELELNFRPIEPTCEIFAFTRIAIGLSFDHCNLLVWFVGATMLSIFPASVKKFCMDTKPSDNHWRSFDRHCRRFIVDGAFG